MTRSTEKTPVAQIRRTLAGCGGSAQGRRRFPTSIVSNHSKQAVAAVMRVMPGFIGEVESRRDPAADGLRKFHVAEAAFGRIDRVRGESLGPPPDVIQIREPPPSGGDLLHSPAAGEE